MTQHSESERYSLKEISANAKDFFLFYLKKLWLLLLFLGAGVAVGFGYFHWQKEKYLGECTFILEEKQGGLGGLGSIASQFGLDVGGLMGGGSIFSGDNIIEILKSRKILGEVLLSSVGNTNTANSGTLADLFVDNVGWKKKWADKPDLKNFKFGKPLLAAGSLTTQQDSVMDLIHTQLLKKYLTVERISKKSSIIKVAVTFSNERFSKEVSERIVQAAKSMYVDLKTSTASSNVRRLEIKADSLLRLLNRKSYQTASSLVIDANPALRTISVPAELNNRDKIVLQTLYGEVVKNLEISRIALMQQMPVIQVLDSPGFPLEDKRTKLFISVLLGGFAFTVIGMGVVLFLFFRRKMP